MQWQQLYNPLLPFLSEQEVKLEQENDPSGSGAQRLSPAQ